MSGQVKVEVSDKPNNGGKAMSGWVEKMRISLERALSVPVFTGAPLVGLTDEEAEKQDRDRFPQAVSAALALHREMECRDEDNEPVGGSYCEECKDLDDHSGERVHEVYPCLTVREITAALAGAETFTAMRDKIEATAK